MENKKRQMRNQFIELRDLIPEEEKQDKSLKIVDRLMKLHEFEVSKRVMCYVNFKSEVATRHFINCCIHMGKRTAVPLTVKGPDCCRTLLACEICDMDSELEMGNYGILEPGKNHVREMDPKILDLVVIPGVIFDVNKNRIGYGGGYYDRFLRTVRNDCFKVGLAFQMQVINSVPTEKHDIPLDMIVTDEKLIR